MNILICSQCSKAIRKNQNGIYCNNSNHWLHVKCTNLTNEEFKLLCKQDDDIPWCCNHCILDVLPFRNVTNSEFLEHQMTKEYIATLELLRVFQSALFQDQIPGQKPSLKFSKFTFHYPSKNIVTTPEVDLTKNTLSILCEQILAKIYSSLRRFDLGKNFLQP